tara:strand:+ start:6203 stop:6568 length:366 start_codon:yes stop_codon:yes gene_type:complete
MPRTEGGPFLHGDGQQENLPLLYKNFDVDFGGVVTSIKMLKVKMADGRFTTMPSINGFMPEYNLLKNGRIRIKFEYKIPYAGHHQKNYETKGFIAYGKRKPTKKELERMDAKIDLRRLASQ